MLHKDKIILKELRETHVTLRIIKKKKYGNDARLIPALKENNELISMFVRACESVESRLKPSKAKHKQNS